ncbi:MAG: hypothetical protein ABJK11_17475, partial [Balneola sp.]
IEANISIQISGIRREMTSQLYQGLIKLSDIFKDENSIFVNELSNFYNPESSGFLANGQYIILF